MSRKPRFRKVQCRYCGSWVTSNALGRASHERSSRCSGRSPRVRVKLPPVAPLLGSDPKLYNTATDHRINAELRAFYWGEEYRDASTFEQAQAIYRKTKLP